VDERGAVNQLDDGAEAYRAPSPIACIPCRKKQQRWAQAFASAGKQIPGNLRYRLDGRAILEREFLLDLCQVVTN
jgi:hypothetical protein